LTLAAGSKAGVLASPNCRQQETDQPHGFGSEHLSWPVRRACAPWCAGIPGYRRRLAWTPRNSRSWPLAGGRMLQSAWCI